MLCSYRSNKVLTIKTLLVLEVNTSVSTSSIIGKNSEVISYSVGAFTQLCNNLKIEIICYSISYKNNTSHSQLSIDFLSSKVTLSMTRRNKNTE